MARTRKENEAPERGPAPTPGTTRRRGWSVLLAPLAAAAAVGGRIAAVFGRGGSALGHEATGALGANVLGHEAAAAGSAKGAAAAGAAPTPPPSGPPAPAVAAGAVATAAVAAAVAVMALGGDPEPEPPVVQPPTSTTQAPAVEPPTSGSGEFVAAASDAVTGNVLADADPGTGGGTIVVIGLEGSADNLGVPVALASGATVTLQADGSFVYEPGPEIVAIASGETVVDEFSYQVTDGAGFTADWIASVVVSGVNDEPSIAEVAGVTVVERATTSVELAATDPDGDSLTFSLQEPAPAFVTLADRGDGTATLSVFPSKGHAGVHQAVVTVVDEGTPPLSHSVVVTFTVAPAAPVRVTDGLLALYTFDEGAGAVVSDSSRAGSKHDLTIADPGAVSWGAGSLTIDAPTTVATADPASPISEAAIASNGITVEAWIVPANATTGGPARIVSISANPGNRNVTLAQGDPAGSGDHWRARLRSTTTGTNGLPALATSPGTAVADQLTHLAFTRTTSGETTIYIDGEVAATGSTDGDLSSWDPTYSLMLANELTGDRPWLGTYHLVAVYGRALAPAEVAQNLRVGP